MLLRLTISNYAIIDNLNVEFHKGLNSVTGETGAGKSIILGALGLILGNRADLSVLKDSTRKCVVEAHFGIKSYNLEPFFTENDLDFSETTIIRREITANGNSRSFINDTPVNLKTLRDLGLVLIDIHSQHQNLELGTHRFQLDLVDTVAKNSIILQEYRDLFTHYKSLQKSLADIIEKSGKEKTELDYWQFQYNQLNEAALIDNEQEELEEELNRLTHAEEIKTVLGEVRQLLDDERFPVLGNLKESKKRLEKIQGYFNSIPELVTRIESAFLELKDILAETDNISDGIEHDPERIGKVTTRLNLIYSLQQKHHVKTVSELIYLKKTLEEKILQVTGYDDEIAALDAKIKLTLELLDHKSAALTVSRKNAFGFIENEILGDLVLLGMPKSRLEIRHENLNDFTLSGKDMISFLFSANNDMPLNEISKVASGGEMSRLMLAIKNLLRKSKTLPTVIFDEIDSGVSGEIALKMGNIIKSFSASVQIINITHLPQIAAKGDAHFMVYKFEENGKTLTSVKLLNAEERIEELAKMVGGNDFSDASLKIAREMIQS